MPGENAASAAPPQRPRPQVAVLDDQLDAVLAHDTTRDLPCMVPTGVRAAPPATADTVASKGVCQLAPPRIPHPGPGYDQQPMSDSLHGESSNIVTGPHGEQCETSQQMMAHRVLTACEMHTVIGLLFMVLLIGCSGGDAEQSPDAPVATAGDCGDGVCGVMENCVTCDADCGICPPGCGDGTCSAAETCQTCSADCGACAPGCGDGVCTSSESCSSCSLDCLCPTAGTQLAAGVGLTFQDVSSDGAYLAYTNASGDLFRVATNGASAPVQVSTGVSKARFKGQFLFTFSGIDATGKYATAMSVFPQAGTAAIRTDGPAIRVKSLTTSADGAHYAYLRGGVGQPRDVLLDGRVIFPAAVSAKIQFTPNSTALIAAHWYLDDGGTQVRPVRAYPVAGGAPVTLVADGAGTSFALTPSGTGVIVAANANLGRADLTLVPITGGTGTVVATGDDSGFRVLPDGTSLIYVDASALRKVDLSGGGGSTLVGSGVITIEDVSQQSIVYATFEDATTGLKTLRIVRVSGPGDSVIGTSAESEHFTPSAAFVGARTNIVGGAGGLTLMSVASLASVSIATDILSSSFPDDTRVVYLDSIGTLNIAAATGGSATVVQARVNRFELVPDSLGSTTRLRAAYVLANGVAAGVYVTPL